MRKKYKVEFELIDNYEESTSDSIKELFNEAMSDNDVELVGEMKITFLEDIKTEEDEDEDDEDEE